MNILIADDHALFRDTLSHYIHSAQPSCVIRLASSLTEAAAILKTGDFRPDLCILDFRMPGMNGFEGIRDIVAAYPHFSFAVMSGMAEPHEIERIISFGVAGFLPKTLAGRILLQAIGVMAKGGRYIPYEEDRKDVLPSFWADRPSGREEKNLLTARERQVLSCLCQGQSNREIADFFNLKTVTIKLHVRSIIRKLGCSNRTQAALKARERGLA